MIFYKPAHLITYLLAYFWKKTPETCNTASYNIVSVNWRDCATSPNVYPKLT